MGEGGVGRVAVVVLVGAVGLHQNGSVNAGGVHATQQVLDGQRGCVEPARLDPTGRVQLRRVQRVGGVVCADDVGLRVYAHVTSARLDDMAGQLAGELTV